MLQSFWTQSDWIKTDSVHWEFSQIKLKGVLLCCQLKQSRWSAAAAPLVISDICVCSPKTAPSTRFSFYFFCVQSLFYIMWAAALFLYSIIVTLAEIMVWDDKIISFESNISWVGWANLHHHLPLCYLELWHGGTIEVHSGRICSIGAHRWMITPIIIIMAPLDNNTNNLISPIFIGPRFDLWVRYSRSLRRHSRSLRTVIRSTMCTAIRGPWVQSPEPKFETLPASQRQNRLRIWLHDVSSKILVDFAQVISIYRYSILGAKN